ncbi:hypothetical protein TNCV_2888791 [Trichonephila clavipes]|nr:hypothetical protein TNCV_2888791 [Trichonephila clavipes]
MALYRSPLTVTKYGPMIPPAHKAHQTELTSITMPVEFNEPLSFLQRISEYMEYSYLLKTASECDDPVKRLQAILLAL